MLGLCICAEDIGSQFVQQIDFGEETGPRTVVSGLVHYIPIDQMRDKYLVGVVSVRIVLSFSNIENTNCSATSSPQICEVLKALLWCFA